MRPDFTLKWKESFREGSRAMTHLMKRQSFGHGRLCLCGTRGANSEFCVGLFVLKHISDDGLDATTKSRVCGLTKPYTQFVDVLCRPFGSNCTIQQWLMRDVNDDSHKSHKHVPEQFVFSDIIFTRRNNEKIHFRNVSLSFWKYTYGACTQLCNRRYLCSLPQTKRG